MFYYFTLASDEEDKRCAVKLLFLEEVKQSNRGW